MENKATVAKHKEIGKKGEWTIHDRKKKIGNDLYIWDKPIENPEHCVYKPSTIGKGKEVVTEKYRIIRDDETQLEFILNKESEKICNFKAYKVVNIPHTYIEIYAFTKPLIPTATSNKEKETNTTKVNEARTRPQFTNPQGNEQNISKPINTTTPIPTATNSKEEETNTTKVNEANRWTRPRFASPLGNEQNMSKPINTTTPTPTAQLPLPQKIIATEIPPSTAAKEVTAGNTTAVPEQKIEAKEAKTTTPTPAQARTTALTKQPYEPRRTIIIVEEVKARPPKQIPLVSVDGPLKGIIYRYHLAEKVKGNETPQYFLGSSFTMWENEHPMALAKAEQDDRILYLSITQDKKMVVMSANFRKEGVCAAEEENEQLTITNCRTSKPSTWTLNQSNQQLTVNGKCVNANKEKMTLELKTCTNESTKWMLTYGNSPDPQKDDPDADITAHRQYIDGLMTKYANTLIDKARVLTCETEKQKKQIVITTAQTNPILAARILNLPACQRVIGNGESLIVQQCKKLTKKVSEIKAIKTTCGYEPIWETNKTISRDGFTETQFIPCKWNNLVNFNGRTFEFDKTQWKSTKAHNQITGQRQIAHVEEIIDREGTYLHNMEERQEERELQGLEAINDLISTLVDNNSKSLTPSVYTVEQRNKVDSVANWFKSWSWTTYVPITLLICAAALVITGTMIECIECYKQERHQRNTEMTTIKTHSHKEIEFDPNNNLFRYEDGCIHHRNE